MDDDELQDDQLDNDGDNDDAPEGSDNSAPPKDAPTPKDESKRVNDLMGKWQAEQARANKLEAQLKARGGGTDTPEGEGSQGDGSEDRVSEFEEFARDNARTLLFNSDSRLAEAGLSAEDITGTKLSEMKASLAKHQKVIGGIEGRMRNKILAEHGLDPEIATGASTEKAPSFSTMSDEEFDKFIEKRDGSRY